MARYIDADEIRRRVKENTNPYGKPTIDYESGVKVLNMIDNAPNADVQEVKHGKFELVGNGKGVCSNCHRLDYIDALAKYCRYCGAKID